MKACQLLILALLLAGSIPALRNVHAIGELVLEMTVDKDVKLIGESFIFNLKVTNTGPNSITATFGDAQTFDIYCGNPYAGGFRWSDGMCFAQVWWQMALGPGESFSRVLSWNLYRVDYKTGEYYPREPGEYHLRPVFCGYPTSYSFANVTIARTHVQAEVCIRPRTLNLNGGNGLASCLVELPAGCDVSKVNAMRLLLGGTEQVNLSLGVIGDCDNDGLQEKVLNFDRSKTSEWALSEGLLFGNMSLNVSGVLADWTLFEGSAVLAVSSLGCDVTCDGLIDICDIVSAASIYDSREGDAIWNPDADVNSPYGIVDIFDLVKIAYHYGESWP